MDKSEVAALEEYLDPSLFDLFLESAATVPVKDSKKEKVASSSCTEFK